MKERCLSESSCTCGKVCGRGKAGSTWPVSLKITTDKKQNEIKSHKERQTWWKRPTTGDTGHISFSCKCITLKDNSALDPKSFLNSDYNHRLIHLLFVPYCRNLKPVHLQQQFQQSHVKISAGLTPTRLIHCRWFLDLNLTVKCDNCVHDLEFS